MKGKYIIGLFLDHKKVTDCVNELIEEGVSKDEIGLMTRTDELNEIDSKGIGFFMKNGDISGEGGGLLVGGLLGTLVGSLIGFSVFAVPGVGLVIGAGSFLTAAFGGVIGAAFGEEAGRLSDLPYTDANPLHPYISSLKDGEVLCGVKTAPESADSISRIIGKYASVIIIPERLESSVMATEKAWI